jgi:exonuclease III
MLGRAVAAVAGVVSCFSAVSQPGQSVSSLIVAVRNIRGSLETRAQYINEYLRVQQPAVLILCETKKLAEWWAEHPEWLNAFPGYSVVPHGFSRDAAVELHRRRKEAEIRALSLPPLEAERLRSQIAATACDQGGVAILIKAELARWVSSTSLDEDSRSIWLHLRFPKSKLTICASYGPSEGIAERNNYMANIGRSIAAFRHPVVLAGDLNQYDDAERDTWRLAPLAPRSNYNKFPAFRSLFANDAMHDAYLLKRGSRPFQFTFARTENEVVTERSRIDHILLNDDMSDCLRDCSIGCNADWGPGFDHAPITAIFDMSAFGVVLPPRTEPVPGEQVVRINTRPSPQQLSAFTEATKFMAEENEELQRLLSILSSPVLPGEQDTARRNLALIRISSLLDEQLYSLAATHLGTTISFGGTRVCLNWEALRLHKQRVRVEKCISGLRAVGHVHFRKFRTMLRKNCSIFKPRSLAGGAEDILYQLKAISKDLRRRISIEESRFSQLSRQKQIEELEQLEEQRPRDFFRKAKSNAPSSHRLEKVALPAPQEGFTSNPATVKSTLRAFLRVFSQARRRRHLTVMIQLNTLGSIPPPTLRLRSALQQSLIEYPRESVWRN